MPPAGPADVPAFPLDTPAIRPLQVQMVQYKGQPLLLARDPLGVVEGDIALVPDAPLMVLMQLADGRTSVDEMASMAMRATGQIIPKDIFVEVVRQLDENLLLFSDRFKAHWEERRRNYAKLEKRPSRMFPPTNNPSDRLKMIADLGAEFRRHTMSPYAPPQKLDMAPGSVRAILAPHIDYERGGEVYNWAYRALAECAPPVDTYFILGVVHRPSMHRFIATAKTFETPFGDVQVDKAMLEEFAAEFGGPLFDDEIQHATEHSIELQVVYLKKLLGDRPFRIVPVLVSAFDDLLEEEGSPKEADPEVGAFAKALRTVLDRHEGRVMLVGGVDLSHCGPAFGDGEPNSPEREKAIETGDREALAAIEKVDAEGFFSTFRGDLNARRVCSIGPIYLVLDALKGKVDAGRILKYRQANSPDRSTLVSFCATAFLAGAGSPEPPKKLILLS
jgi:AmmeMemoRadiSam system protein B